MLAAMASAGDESPGGDGTTNGDVLRAPLETGAREPTPWGNRTIGRDGLRAPLETGVREPTLWFDRIEPGANDPRTWRDRAIGDDWSLGSTETSYEFLCLLKVAIWCLTIMRDALQHIRARRERVVQSPV